MQNLHVNLLKNYSDSCEKDLFFLILYCFAEDICGEQFETWATFMESFMARGEGKVTINCKLLWPVCIFILGSHFLWTRVSGSDYLSVHMEVKLHHLAWIITFSRQMVVFSWLKWFSSKSTLLLKHTHSFHYHFIYTYRWTEDQNTYRWPLETRTTSLSLLSCFTLSIKVKNLRLSSSINNYLYSFSSSLSS